MHPSCYRCSADFVQTDPTTIYCADCVSSFKEAQTAARAKQKHGGQHFATGAFCKPPSPVTFLKAGRAHCGLCGSDKVSKEYGHCLYGCGTYSQCETCRTQADFVADSGK